MHNFVFWSLDMNFLSGYKSNPFIADDLQLSRKLANFNTKCDQDLDLCRRKYFHGNHEQSK